MANLHDLATTIGNSSLIGFLSALAAGLAAIALMSGSSKVRGSTLPSDFPGDQEAQLDKYLVPFTQLDQVNKDKAEIIDELTDQLKNQPAAHLALTAFQLSAAHNRTESPGQGAKPAQASAKASKPKHRSAAPHLSAPSSTSQDEDDFSKTIDVSRPKPTDKKVK